MGFPFRIHERNNNENKNYSDYSENPNLPIHQTIGGAMGGDIPAHCCFSSLIYWHKKTLRCLTPKSFALVGMVRLALTRSEITRF